MSVRGGLPSQLAPHSICSCSGWERSIVRHSIEMAIADAVLRWPSHIQLLQFSLKRHNVDCGLKLAFESEELHFTQPQFPTESRCHVHASADPVLGQRQQNKLQPDLWSTPWLPVLC